MRSSRLTSVLLSITALSACAPLPADPPTDAATDAPANPPMDTPVQTLVEALLPPEPVRFDLDINGRRHPFNSTIWASAVGRGETLFVRVAARNDPYPRAVDDENTMYFEARFDRAAFATLARGVPLPIDGTTTIANVGTGSHNTTPLDPALTSFVPGLANTPAVHGVTLWNQCFCNRPAGPDVQPYTGTVTLTDVSLSRVRFEFSLAARGTIPFQGDPLSRTPSDIRLSASFVARLRSAQ